jgi:very-short-patch-repair endonuclease/predicted transcriptional regulator of viral defense system
VGVFVEVSCSRVASKQLGTIARDQAVSCGASKDQIARFVQSGRWVRVCPGVYRVLGAPETWRQRVMAVSLWAGRRAAFSHRTAAALWGFSRFRETRDLHVTLDRRALEPVDVVTHRAPTLSSRDIANVDGVRVTSVARTLLDLSATESRQDVRAAVEEALRRKWTTVERLAEFVEAHRGHRGVALLRELTEAFLGGEGPAESELESRVLDLLEEEGLPRPQKQRSLRLQGRLRRVDFSFPGTRVLLEADGYAWHSTPEAFEKDRARVSALTARGYRVLHWTWRGLTERPDELVEELRRALQLDRAPSISRAA